MTAGQFPVFCRWISREPGASRLPVGALYGEGIGSVPKVLVIMPAFQAARTVVRAIESVRAQDYPDWKLIVVDDASDDQTGDLAQSIADRDLRIEVLRNQKNLGAAASMNRAWQHADSEYVAVVDADDAVLPNRLAAPLQRFESAPNLSVIGGAAHFVDVAQRYLRTVTLPASHEVLYRRRWYACPFVHPSVTMRRSFLERTKGYQDGLRLGEDYDLWMRGFQEKEIRYENLRQPLVIYTAKAVQRWTMIKASARVRRMAGEREGKQVRGSLAALRILAEGAVEQTGLFAWRDRNLRRLGVPAGLGQWGVRV